MMRLIKYRKSMECTFTTGYLTHKGRTESGKYRLVIPNREVRNLFVKKIREWLSDVTKMTERRLISSAMHL